MNPKQSTKWKLPWIQYLIEHNRFEAINTHILKQVVTKPINIKHEYEPLMCTHEFEIMHASKTYLSLKRNLKQRQFRIQPKNNQQSHGFISILWRNQCKKLS